MVPEHVWDWHFCSYWCVFFIFCFFFLSSSLVWFFLWLPEEVLTLLFLLHCENGDFSILMKDITTDYGIGILAVWVCGTAGSCCLWFGVLYLWCIQFISVLCTRPQSCIFSCQICQIFLVPLLPLVASRSCKLWKWNTLEIDQSKSPSMLPCTSVAEMLITSCFSKLSLEQH